MNDMLIQKYDKELLNTKAITKIINFETFNDFNNLIKITNLFNNEQLYSAFLNLLNENCLYIFNNELYVDKNYTFNTKIINIEIISENFVVDLKGLFLFKNVNALTIVSPEVINLNTSPINIGYFTFVYSGINENFSITINDNINEFCLKNYKNQLSKIDVHCPSDNNKKKKMFVLDGFNNIFVNLSEKLWDVFLSDNKVVQFLAHTKIDDIYILNKKEKYTKVQFDSPCYINKIQYINSNILTEFNNICHINDLYANLNSKFYGILFINDNDNDTVVDNIDMRFSTSTKKSFIYGLQQKERYNEYLS